MSAELQPTFTVMVVLDGDDDVETQTANARRVIEDALDKATRDGLIRGFEVSEGLTALERAAVEFIEAGQAEADRVVRTGRAMDAKSPEWQRKTDAHLALIAEVRGRV